MSLINLFIQLKEIENKTAELYEFIHQKIAHRFPNLASVFQELAQEEKVHEKEVDLVYGIYKESHHAFIENPEAVDEAREIIETLEQCRIFIEQKIDSIGVKEIINLIMEFETNMEGIHQSFYYHVTDEELKKLFKYLTNADKSHFEKIQKLAQLQ